MDTAADYVNGLKDAFFERMFNLGNTNLKKAIETFTSASQDVRNNTLTIHTTHARLFISILAAHLFEPEILLERKVYDLYEETLFLTIASSNAKKETKKILHMHRIDSIFLMDGPGLNMVPLSGICVNQQGKACILTCRFKSSDVHVNLQEEDPKQWKIGANLSVFTTDELALKIVAKKWAKEACNQLRKENLDLSALFSQSNLLFDPDSEIGDLYRLLKLGYKLHPNPNPLSKELVLFTDIQTVPKCMQKHFYKLKSNKHISRTDRFITASFFKGMNIDVTPQLWHNYKSTRESITAAKTSEIQKLYKVSNPTAITCMSCRFFATPTQCISSEIGCNSTGDIEDILKHNSSFSPSNITILINKHRKKNN